MRATIEDVRFVRLPSKIDPRGGLTIAEFSQLPFVPRRAFWLHGIEPNAERGHHAHKECHQLLIPMSGAFGVRYTDGILTRDIHLHDLMVGLHVPPMIWATEHSFTPHAVCLVLASHPYDEDDYYRDYNLYLEAIEGTR